jgi:glucans biosynthesis protein C
MRTSERLLLWAGVAVPVLYFGNLLLNALLYPGYSHVRQYVSELGGPEAPHATLFNTGVVLFGLAAMAAGGGFGLALRRRGSGRVLAVAVGALVVLFGAGMILAGVFPMPDPRHGGYGLPMGVHIVPPLLAWGLRRRPELRWLRLFLWVSFVAMVTLFAIMMGVGELVTRANVGLFQRAYALAMFPWIGIAAAALVREPAERAVESAPLAHVV